MQITHLLLEQAPALAPQLPIDQAEGLIMAARPELPVSVGGYMPLKGSRWVARL